MGVYAFAAVGTSGAKSTEMFYIMQVVKNQRQRRPGNEANPHFHPACVSLVPWPRGRRETRPGYEATCV